MFVLRKMKKGYRNRTLLCLILKKLDLVKTVGPLDRIFNLYTATLFGIGATFGNYFFDFRSNIAYDLWIYSIFVYVIGGALTLLISSFYAELASQMPSSGGLYTYCYNFMGEIYAFMAGWLLILLYSFKFMMITNTLSDYVSHFFFENELREVDFSFWNHSYNFGGLYASLITAGLVSTSIRESHFVISLLVVINIASLVVTSLIYIFFAEINMTIKKPVTNASIGEIIEKSFNIVHQGYLGFQSVVHLGEETQNPQESIPRSVSTVITVVIACYVYIEILHVSLRENYDEVLKTGNLFTILNKLMISYEYTHLLGLGGICSIAAACYTTMFTLVRLMHSMSSDGLLFKFLSSVHHRNNNIVFSTFIAATLLGLIQEFFKRETFKEHIIFLTFVEYLLVTLCLLLMRYKSEESSNNEGPVKRWLLLNCPNKVKTASRSTYNIAKQLITLTTLSLYIFSMSISMSHSLSPVISKSISFISLLSAISFGFFLSRQPRVKRDKLHCWTVGVPYLQLFTLAYLLMCLSSYRIELWLVPCAWQLLGVVMYLAYSQYHSVEGGKVFPHNPDERWNIMLTNEIITANGIESD